MPRLAAPIDEAGEDVLAFMALPEGHRAAIHSTDPLGRPNAEAKRRTDVVGISSNEAAATRPGGAIPLEQNDERAAQRRCMSLETLAPVSDAPVAGPPAVAG